MANYKISQLPSSSALTSDDFLPIVDSGTLTTQRATAQQVLNYITGSTFNSLTVTNLTSSKSISEEYLATKKITISNSAGTVFQMSAVSDELLFDVNPTARNVQFFKNSVETASFGSGADWTTIGNTLGSAKVTIGDVTINSSGLSSSNITASNIQAYEQRVDYILNTNFFKVSGASLVTDMYQDTATRFLVDTTADHFQFFKLATPVTAGFGNNSTSLTKINGINVEVGNSVSTVEVKVQGILTGSTGRFTTLSSSNSIVSGNLVLEGQADLTAYPDYAYIIYTSSYDKLVAFPGLYVSGSLTGSGNAKFNEVSGTIAQFSEISASIISASSYVGETATFGIIKSPNITTYGDSSIGTVLYTNDSEQITGDYNKLLFDYSNNILSGVIADFDQITGSVSFTANDPALWASSTPITIQDAINRIAAAVYSGNTGLIA